jgi:hypothetical protein
VKRTVAQVQFTPRREYLFRAAHLTVKRFQLPVYEYTDFIALLRLRHTPHHHHHGGGGPAIRYKQ